MAALPATRPSQTLSESQLEALIDAIARGEHPKDVARRLHPHNQMARRRTRLKLERYALEDPRVAAGVGDRARMTMLVGLGPATVGMNRRAAKGNMLAAKLLFEASGFHNPKVQHQHSGEITVKLDMPRPTFEGDGKDEPVIDATVVDD